MKEMLRNCVMGLLLAFSSQLLMAAPVQLLPPLASSSAVPCAKRSGIRASRSELVQLGDVTVSLGEQSSREGNTCVYSAALWITQRDVSQQIELPRAATNTFSIVDLSPDASSVLLTAQDKQSLQLAVLALSDGALRWMPISQWLGFSNCDNAFSAQGFEDGRHIVLAALPRPASQECAANSDLYSVDLDTRRAKSISFSNVIRSARSVSGPMRSCKSDPDVVRACYRARARLSVSDDGDGLVLWTVGSHFYLAVEGRMVPGDLDSDVTPEMRMYGTMTICPMTVERYSRRPVVCVESAEDLRPDPVPARIAGSGSGITRR